MFKIVKERRAWWPVKFNGVTGEGRVVENEIELRFNILSEDEHAQLQADAAKLAQRAEEMVREEAGDEELVEDEAERRTLAVLSRLYAEFTRRIAVDWRKVGAENGDPLPFEDENIRLLMNVPGVFKATVAAYGRCRIGEKDTRAGN